MCIYVFYLFLRSVGVSNFNVYHLEKLLEATPDSVPSGVCMCVCVGGVPVVAAVHELNGLCLAGSRNFL